MRTIEHRLSRLEAQQRPPEPPGPEPTPEEFLVSLFVTRQLWFTDGGQVCAGPVGLTADLAWRQEIAALLNAEKRDMPLIPLTPTVANEAAAALRSGRLRIEPVRNGNGQPTGHQRLGMGYTVQGWAYECNYLAWQVNVAIEACAAQGVAVVWTVAGIVELLEAATL